MIMAPSPAVEFRIEGARRPRDALGSRASRYRVAESTAGVTSEKNWPTSTGMRYPALGRRAARLAAPPLGGGHGRTAHILFPQVGLPDRSSKPRAWGVLFGCAIILAAATLSCAAPAPVTTRTPDPSPRTPEAVVSVALALTTTTRGDAVAVTYTIHTEDLPLASPLRMALPHRWAGRTGYLDDIQHIRAVSCDDQPLNGVVDADTGIARWEHPDLACIRVSYDVAPQRQRFTSEARYRAVQTASVFHGPGHAVFARPLSVPSSWLSRVHVAVALESNPDRVIRATIPIDGTMTRLDDLVEASIFAGHFARVSRADGPRTLDLYSAPGVRAAPGGLADVAMRTVSAQADLLGEALAQHTVVLVLPRHDDPSALTGNGRLGGFVLEVGELADPLGEPVAALMAHENLHRLIGHDLRFSSNEEFATLWFREGVTDYLSVRTRVDAGLAPTSTLFRYIGTALSNYRGNPMSTRVAAADIDETFWLDLDVRRLPYDKGALIATILDVELRTISADQTERSLRGYISFLRDDPSARAAPLNNAALRDALQRYSGRDWTDFWERYVTGAEPLPIFDTLNRAGLEVVERLEPAPYFGLRVSVTHEGGWYISDVSRGSPADRAGLQPGLTLREEPRIPLRDPLATARLVLDGRNARTVEITPDTGQRRTFGLVATPRESVYFLEAFGLQHMAERPASHPATTSP